MDNDDREEFDADPVKHVAFTFLNTADTFCTDLCRKFEMEMQDMSEKIQKLFSETGAPMNKRKLKSILEDEVLEESRKKNRPSGDFEDDSNFAEAHSNSNTSTPIDKIVLQPKSDNTSTIIQNSLSSTIESDQTIRSKRQASLRATSINNKLLNLKSNGKMRQSKSCQNFYDKIINGDKENMHEISHVKCFENSNEIIDVSFQESIKENTNNINNKDIIIVTDNNLMPPPKLPAKKKRAVKANNSSNQSIDNYESDASLMKPTKKQKRKKAPENSLLQENNDDIQTQDKTRLTRSQSRLMSMSQVNETTVVTIKRKRKTKSQTENNKILSNMDHNEMDSYITTINSSDVPKDDNQPITFEELKTENPTNHENTLSPSINKNKQIENSENEKKQKGTLVPQSQNLHKTMNSPMIDNTTFININISQCDPLCSSTLPISEMHAIKNTDKQNNFDETIVIESNIYQSKKSKSSNEIKENVEYLPAINFNETINLAPKKNALQPTINETIVLSKDNPDLYDASRSILVDDLSDIDEVPSKIPLLKEALNNNKLYESPVKSRVKHFEKLTEMSKKDANPLATLPVLTRLKTRSDRSHLIPKNLPVSNKSDFVAVINPKVVPSPNTKILSKPGPSIVINQTKKNQLRKWDEKSRNAALNREAQEKLKQAQLLKTEKERREKLRQHQQERDEELKRKKQVQQCKLAEVEERRKQEESSRKMLALEVNDDNNMKQYRIELEFNKMIQEDEDMENDEKQTLSEKEKRKIKAKRTPDWAKRENLDQVLTIQEFIKPKIIDMFYQTSRFVPNLSEIFPGIKSSKLQRNSSAVWKTPPRSSMMPKIE